MVVSAHWLSSLHHKVATWVFADPCFAMFFFTFEPTFGMMSCLTLQLWPCAPLCFMCESAHRLRDLLSSLQICKRVVHDILKKVLAICGTVFTFCCGQGPNCRTVVSFGGFILASAPGFLGPSALSRACFTLCFTAVRPLWTVVFSWCSLQSANRYFLTSTPHDCLGTLTFKFTP